MAKYQFEYANQKYSLTLFLISFVTFFGLLFSMTQFKRFFNIYFIMLISFGIPILIFWLNKHKIKKDGFAILEDNFTEIYKLDKVQRINFHEIKNYQVQDYNNNISLIVNLKNGKTISLSSISSFCKTENFENYCKELEVKLENYLTVNELECARKKSFFEKPWFYPFLVIVTAVILVFTIIVIVQSDKNPLPILLGAVGPLLTLWGGYLNAKNKSKIK